jgi:hypothetical protein
MSTSRRSLVATGVLAAAVVSGGIAMPSPALAAPSNDNFQFAQFLPGPNNSIGGRNHDATAEAGEPKHAGVAANRSVWYRWTAPATGKAIFRTKGSNFDTVLSVYQGNSLNGLVLVADDDDTPMSDGSTKQSQVVFKATKGAEYKIAVDAFNTAEVSGDVRLTWTGNDDFAAAETRPGPAPTFSVFAVHTDGTSAEPGEPAHAGSAAASSAWYRWVAPSDGIATFEAIQGKFNTRLAAYKGSAVNALTLVAQNDDASATNNRARIVFVAKAGTEYRIALDGVGGAQGFENVRYTLVKPEVRIVDALPVIEGNSGTKTVNLQVALNTTAPFPVTVKFATKDGTAVAGSDYTAASGTVTFPAGFLFKQVPVQIKGDTAKEVAEKFSVELSAPSGGFAIGKGSGSVTISNDD